MTFLVCWLLKEPLFLVIAYDRYLKPSSHVFQDRHEVIIMPFSPHKIIQVARKMLIRSPTHSFEFPFYHTPDSFDGLSVYACVWIHAVF